MYISRLVVRNFRNFRLLDISLEPGVTCFIGENNTGKTNLMYAVRLAIDASLSSYRRRLNPEDFFSELTHREAEQILISIEFSGFEESAVQQAMVFHSQTDSNHARITYRYRPRRTIREAISKNKTPATGLTINDYRWELTGGGSNDPTELAWDDDYGVLIRTDDIFQAFVVVTLDALRDAKHIISGGRESPLRKLLGNEDVPEDEQEALVALLRSTNDRIAESPTIKTAGAEIHDSLQEAAGAAFSLDVRLGMEAATFADITQSLSLLLSNDALSDFSPRSNGMGLNNLIYASMLMQYFRRRVEEGKTAGQLLLFEEPEAHLHPQLERVLFNALQKDGFQIFATTHSSHISSQSSLSSVILLTNDGSSATVGFSPVRNAELENDEIRDLERYLDATRGTLLFAKRVLLVEGPAELFLIPPLVQSNLDINLDDYGVAVIPIYGTHFSSYAKLFGDECMPKKCAILTDGDRDSGGGEVLPENEGACLTGYKTELCSTHVEVFACHSTFERTLVSENNLPMLASVCSDLGARRLFEKLSSQSEKISQGEEIDWDDLRGDVLNAAKRFGKARFAQVAARHVPGAKDVPDYLVEAIGWLIQ